MIRTIRYEFRRRTNVEESVTAVHRRLATALSVPGRLRTGQPVLEDPEFGTGLEAQVSITGALEQPLEGYVAYVWRGENYLRDSAEFDDRIIVCGELSLDLHRDFCHTAFKDLIIAFDAYRAIAVLDDDLALDDWDYVSELVRSGEAIDPDGRNGIHRVSPVAYYDSTLCSIAFGQTAEELCSRFENSSFGVERFGDGLLILADLEFPTRDELLAFDREFRRSLAQ